MYQMMNMHCIYVQGGSKKYAVVLCQQLTFLSHPVVYPTI